MHYTPSIQQDNTPCNSSSKNHAITRDQGGDIFDLPPYSVVLTPIVLTVALFKLHVSRMSNIEDRSFFGTTIKFGAP